jgi:hypothetical protein
MVLLTLFVLRFSSQSCEEICYVFFSFLGWSETDSMWYVGHYFTYGVSPRWYMLMMNMEQSVEWMARETEVHGGNLSTTNPALFQLDSNFGRSGGKPASNGLSYRTAFLFICLQSSPLLHNLEYLCFGGDICVIFRKIYNISIDNNLELSAQFQSLLLLVGIPNDVHWSKAKNL